MAWPHGYHARDVHVSPRGAREGRTRFGMRERPACRLRGSRAASQNLPGLRMQIAQPSELISATFVRDASARLDARAVLGLVASDAACQSLGRRHSALLNVKPASVLIQAQGMRSPLARYTSYPNLDTN